MKIYNVNPDLQDTNPKGLEINTRLLCYSGMQKYSSKSLTELRIEDYMANRKAGNPSGSSGPRVTIS